MNGFIGLLAPFGESAAGELGIRISKSVNRLGSLDDVGVCVVAPVSTGCRPVAPPVGPLIFHGRLDNGNELLSDLQGAWGATDDQSLAAAAFERWGTDAVARMRGNYALAYWDASSERLILACDPLGLRTIYYARLAGALVFATALPPLLALADMPRDIDDAYLAGFLIDLPQEREATFYRAIRRIPAACTAACGPDGSMRLHEYWRPDWERRIRHSRDEAYVEEARALLDQAVRRQIRDLDPVVCQLSGGLDSAGVAATAARLRAPAVVHALTRVPPDGVPRWERPSFFSNEREHAAAVAQFHPSLAWEAVSAEAPHPLETEPSRIFLAIGMPLRGVANAGWFAPMHERAHALGAQGMLTGQFGNLGLSWDGLSGLTNMARRGDWARLWREVNGLSRATGQSPLALLRRYAVKPLLPRRIRELLAARRGVLRSVMMASAIHPDFARRTRVCESWVEERTRPHGDSTTARERWFVSLQRLAATISAMDPVRGFAVRDPTADLDLLEFCFAVPDEQYLRNGVSRWLARRVLADRLPPEVVNETRKGYQCADFLHRMTLQRDAIIEGVEALERSPLASRTLDVARLKQLAANWPTDPAAARPVDYKAVLYRGLHIGRFLRWIEGGNQ